MTTTLERGRFQADEHVAVDKSFHENPREWLARRAKELGLTYLLAHAEDGVLWGRFEDGSLRLAGEDGIFPELRATLSADSLLDARAFGVTAELFLWKEGNAWRARLIRDGVGDEGASFVEEHWLWGTPHADATGALEARDGFTLLVEGAQGMRHAPPLAVGVNRRAALVVRHYLEHDAEGQAYVAWSRLVSLEMAKEESHGPVSK